MSVDSGIGDATVTVPADTDVTIDVRRPGHLTLYGERVSARHVQRTDIGADGPGGGSLDLTITSGVGEVEVTRASA